MKVTIEGRRAFVPAPIPNAMLILASRLEGKKYWLKGGGFGFEPTFLNLELFRKQFPDAEFDDQRAQVVGVDLQGQPAVIQGRRTGLGPGNPTARGSYASKTQPFGRFQTDAFNLMLKNDVGALFMEQGTGKSKVTIDVIGERWCRGEIDAAIIIALNGVHRQWIDEQIPKHLGEMVPCRMWAWNGKELPDAIYKKDKLAVFTINFDAVRTKAGRKTIDRFLASFNNRVFIGVDESQEIKNDQTARTIEITEIGASVQYKMIITGTPIAKNLVDEWSQFKFLGPHIIGHEYKTSFQAQYCTMHPTLKGKVIGSKNVEAFYERVSPYTYRVTKAEALDLPPKVYDKYVFELHPEQRRLYDEMRDKLRIQLDSGEISSVKNAAVALLRLQQITCGYLALDKDDPDEATRFEILPNARLEALKRVRASRMGKAVVWARFNKDIENAMSVLEKPVSYYGATKDIDRQKNKRMFIDDPSVTDFVSNPAAGGTGVDGLQAVGRTAIYYSNSFNSIQRWQSEDRTHRIGMTGTCTYIDLVARNTVDSRILRVHKMNKALSDLVLDDIRMMLEDVEI